jgi:hypothetical protein
MQFQCTKCKRIIDEKHTTFYSFNGNRKKDEFRLCEVCKMNLTPMDKG